MKLRKAILEKRIEMQKFKLEIKLHQIINPQILLLNQWAKLEKKNQESVSRVVRKLSGISVRLPLVEGAKVLPFYLLFFGSIYVYYVCVYIYSFSSLPPTYFLSFTSIYIYIYNILLTKNKIISNLC